jgi:molecular chaperone DnaK
MHPFVASTACRVRKTVGIDLGTTNSVIALLDPTDTTLITGHDDQGRLTFPSIVGFDRGRDHVLVGRPALGLNAGRESEDEDAPVTLPLASIKRFMGTNRRFTVGPNRFTPQQVSSHILRYLREVMAATLTRQRLYPPNVEQELDSAIITMPAYFNHNQIEATRAAGELAGFEVVELLHEPTAAAIYYSWLHNHGDATYLVYDLGGGTFDVSVIRRRLGDYEVLSVSGDPFLGGDDFDRLLATHLIETGTWSWHEEGHTEAVRPQQLEDIFDPLGTNTLPFARLVRLAEGVKSALTGETIVHRFFPQVCTLDGRALALECSVDRAGFDGLIREKVARTIDCCREALGRSKDRGGVGLPEIDHVILVGGSSRVPLVRETVTAAFCNAALPEHARNTELLLHEPDLCVAYGAALRAATHGSHYCFTLSLPEEPAVAEIEDEDEQESLEFALPEEELAEEPLELDLHLTSPGSTDQVRYQATGVVRMRGAEEGKDENLLDGASIRIRSLMTGLVEEVFLDAKGTFVQELELQPEADNPLEWGVCDAAGRELARVMTVVRHRSESRHMGQGVLATQLITRPLQIEVLTAARRRVKQVIAPVGAPLPGRFSCVCRTTDQSGRIVVPIFEDNRVVKQLIIENLPLSLPVGSPVDVEFSIDTRHTIEVSVRVRRAQGEQDRLEKAVIDAPPATGRPTRAEIDEVQQQIDELLPLFSGAFRSKLRARAEQIRKDLLEALSYDDEPRAIQRMAEFRGLASQLDASRGQGLDPPWPRFAGLVEKCRELSREVAGRTGRDHGELVDYIDSQERYAEQAHEEQNQGLYRECHDNLVKYSGYLSQLLSDSLPRPPVRPQRPPEEEAREEVERFRFRLSVVWKQARARGRADLEARLKEIASSAGGLSARLKNEPVAVLREARRLGAEVEKIAAQTEGKPRTDDGDDAGLLEGPV